jgi:3-methylfumaryl-CoA hydratase
MMLDIVPLKKWIGRQETADDSMAAFPAAALAATLNRDDAPGKGEPLPPLWHWVYFLELHRQAELAGNGHARLGGFLPPVPLPRRMFAGARLSFLRPLRIGEEARRVSTIAGVSVKKGASGDLVFVAVRNEITGPGGPAIVEEQDLVYREAARPESAPPPAMRRSTSRAAWKREMKFDVALLFRYSALLFNAYRIHYDRPYALEQGYAGLVVHGQLIATLLADLLRRNSDAPITTFRYRSVSPLVDGSPCVLCGVPEGSSVNLWAEDGSGGLVVQAEAELAER